MNELNCIGLKNGWICWHCLCLSKQKKCVKVEIESEFYSRKDSPVLFEALSPTKGRKVLIVLPACTNGLNHALRKLIVKILEGVLMVRNGCLSIGHKLVSSEIGRAHV